MSNPLHIQYTDYYGKLQTAVIPIPDANTSILIGRRDTGHHPTINLSWNHSVSRSHLRIFYEYDAWHIEQIADRNQTVVNDDPPLVPGVPQVLPAQAEIKVGGNSKVEPTLLRVQHGKVEHEAPGDDVIVPTGYDRPVSDDDTESKRVELLAQLSDQLASPDSTLLIRLLGVIQTEFPQADAGGIALYDDRQIRIPASFPRGAAQMSFRLARRVLRSQQTLRWEKRMGAADTDQNFTSLGGTNEAIYVPLLRGQRKLGLVYLHTSGLFPADDAQRLQTVGDTLANHPDFDPDTAHLRMPSVFVSYSRQNKDFVRQLVNDVRRQRVSVWWDERLRAGKDWEKQLATAIQKSDTFALVMSPPSLASKYVQWEIQQARLAGKPIIPLYYAECEVPDDLSKNQRIAIDDPNYADGVLELVETLYDYMDERITASLPDIGVSLPDPDQPVRILFLAANPTNTTQLRLGEEVRQIETYLRGSTYRDRFELKSEWAVRPDDLRSALLRHQPHIVHFSGHGGASGTLILEDNRGEAFAMEPAALKALFKALRDEQKPTNNVRLVVLNACYSATQAQPIAEAVGCVVGMTRAIGDPAAIGFASAFYEVLGYGRNVQQAFNVGKAQMALHKESETPVLLAHGIDPTQLTFVSPD